MIPCNYGGKDQKPHYSHKQNIQNQSDFKCYNIHQYPFHNTKDELDYKIDSGDYHCRRTIENIRWCIYICKNLHPQNKHRNISNHIKDQCCANTTCVMAWNNQHQSYRQCKCYHPNDNTDFSFFTQD